MILNNKITKYSNKIDTLIKNYNFKIGVLKFLIGFTNVTFSVITLLLVIISTFNIAGAGYETAIKGDDYIILSTFISSMITMINSLVSFFFLKEKINEYRNTKYKLILEKQKYDLDHEIYNGLDKKQKETLLENKIFQIVSGFEKISHDDSMEGGK